jgi:hypothetical protein
MRNKPTAALNEALHGGVTAAQRVHGQQLLRRWGRPRVRGMRGAAIPHGRRRDQKVQGVRRRRRPYPRLAPTAPPPPPTPPKSRSSSPSSTPSPQPRPPPPSPTRLHSTPSTCSTSPPHPRPTRHGPSPCVRRPPPRPSASSMEPALLCPCYQNMISPSHRGGGATQAPTTGTERMRRGPQPMR